MIYCELPSLSTHMELSSEAVHHALALLLLFRDSGVRGHLLLRLRGTPLIADRCADQPRWVMEVVPTHFKNAAPFKRKRERVLAFVVGSS